jgi:hypothetical protein
MIQPSNEYLRQLEIEFLEELKPFQVRIAAIIACSPVSYYTGDGKLSVAIYPAEVQAQLDKLQGYMDAIAEKYKALVERPHPIDIIREVLTQSRAAPVR